MKYLTGEGVSVYHQEYPMLGKVRSFFGEKIWVEFPGSLIRLFDIKDVLILGKEQTEMDLPKRFRKAIIL